MLNVVFLVNMDIKLCKNNEISLKKKTDFSNLIIFTDIHISANLSMQIFIQISIYIECANFKQLNLLTLNVYDLKIIVSTF